MTPGTGASGRTLHRGRFHADRWHGGDGRTHELFVSGERLADGAEATFTTLLHEATHALAACRGVQDTSRGGRYHNGRFVALAKELGLAYAHDGPDSSTGFSDVTMTKATAATYARTIAALDRAITHHLTSQPAAGGAKASRLIKATCPCGRIIRLSAAVLDQAPITCGNCGQDFTPAAGHGG